MINSFRGEYRFLSNFHPSKVILSCTNTDHPYSVIFPTVENAYQAAKNIDEAQWSKFINIPPGKAKGTGRKLDIRPDWEVVKVGIMEELLEQKFRFPELRDKLLATKNQELIEGNWWGDTFWGVCKGEGQNILGKLLMKIRRGLHALYNPLYHPGEC